MDGRPSAGGSCVESKGNDHPLLFEHVKRIVSGAPRDLSKRSFSHQLFPACRRRRFATRRPAGDGLFSFCKYSGVRVALPMAR